MEASSSSERSHEAVEERKAHHQRAQLGALLTVLHDGLAEDPETDGTVREAAR